MYFKYFPEFPIFYRTSNSFPANNPNRTFIFYNNSIFIQGLCQQFGLDEKDLFSFFLEMRMNHESDLYAMMETYEISKLDINRIYRYIDKYTIDDGCSGDGDEECVDEMSE